MVFPSSRPNAKFCFKRFRPISLLSSIYKNTNHRDPSVSVFISLTEEHLPQTFISNSDQTCPTTDDTMKFTTNPLLTLDQIMSRVSDFLDLPKAFDASLATWVEREIIYLWLWSFCVGSRRFAPRPWHYSRRSLSSSYRSYIRLPHLMLKTGISAIIILLFDALNHNIVLI